MNAFVDGLGALLDVSVVLYMLVGLALGFLVGAFPGITATMAVALAAGFTMTLEPVQGLAVLLTIYVAANFGDRVPSILVNTPGTPASVATTFDGYPMAKQGRAGLALTLSAIVSAARHPRVDRAVRRRWPSPSRPWRATSSGRRSCSPSSCSGSRS